MLLCYAVCMRYVVLRYACVVHVRQVVLRCACAMLCACDVLVSGHGLHGLQHAEV